MSRGAGRLRQNIHHRKAGKEGQRDAELKVPDGIGTRGLVQPAEDHADSYTMGSCKVPLLTSATGGEEKLNINGGAGRGLALSHSAIRKVREQGEKKTLTTERGRTGGKSSQQHKNRYLLVKVGEGDRRYSI